MIGACAHVAPGIVASGILASTFAAACTAQAVETAQLMG
jgi:hypothetical protein